MVRDSVRHRWGKGGAALAAIVAAFLLVSISATGQEADKESAVFSESGAETCLGCHNSPDMLAVFRTPHGQQADPDSPMASAQCESCHGPAGEHSDRRIGPRHSSIVTFGVDAPTPVSEQDAVCTSCHQSDMMMSWVGSEHAQSDVSCSGCHNVHDAIDAVSTHAGQNDVCFDCHQRQESDSLKPSSHPLRSDQPARVASMVCSDCHNPHGSVASGLLTRNTTNELCFECHAEYRGPVLFDHAPVSEDCSLCHNPHGSVHPSLLTKRAPLLCQSCHSRAGHPSTSFTDESLPGGQPTPMVIGQSCQNCHTQVHGSNHPSGIHLMR